MLLREVGRLIAVLDKSVWLKTPKKDNLDISIFWSNHSAAFEAVITGDFVIPADEYKQRRAKLILSKDKFWKSDIELIKKLYWSNELTIHDINLVFDGYQEEAENIAMAEDLSQMKEVLNLSASEIGKLMNINKNSVLAWISHKRNMPKQAYKEACEKLKNFR
ncbi:MULTISPECIES: hypothetical protein [unclassified Acinetobacter]|uniref:hypothetical protein n=1 Tax=unclassified Acinetobacter TaxID=196816 RepID=UPI00211EAF89|nr:MULTISPECIES: hypothetical protein [unclassified Acinetobacter]UUS62535.1 hypothetical protein MST17_16635 [Acinetobacter sp. YH16056_T]